jgi:pimeloyl-ACP methyl ester carboxylesterase
VDRQIESALRLAQEADQVAADALASLTALPASSVPASSVPAGLPAPGATVKEVAGYWADLTASQRWWLMTNRPAAVGSLDGIPAADRDTANRLVLASERDRLSTLRNSTSDPPPLTEVERLDGQLRGLDAIDARLRDPELARAYLLELSTVDDGRAVIAAGDPDQATDVLIYVPGTGSDLSGVDTLVARSDAVSQDGARIAPEHRVSVVTWLGYDPPDGVTAISPSAAYHAEPALDAFTEGLRATHVGQPSHNTVLGHSYGSLVAGVTARDRGLDTDDLIFVGSPGVGVDRAADLGLPSAAVWSSTAADDPVQRFAPGWGQLAADALTDAIRPFSAWYGDTTPDQLLWYGRNPSMPAFGGQVFASDPDGGHSGYWKGAALDAITRITVDLDAPTP